MVYSRPCGTILMARSRMIAAKTTRTSATICMFPPKACERTARTYPGANSASIAKSAKLPKNQGDGNERTQSQRRTGDGGRSCRAGGIVARPGQERQYD